MGRAPSAELSAFFLPNEKALPAALSEAKPLDSGIGGADILAGSFGKGFSSTVMSVDDGKVDEELKRAEDDELS